LYFIFFFSSRRRHTRFDCDWSSDVCSSDLLDESTSRGWPPTATVKVMLGAASGATGGTDTMLLVTRYGVRSREATVCSLSSGARSEERRVGKECRARGLRYR